jgi:tellurite methyltransferase
MVNWDKRYREGFYDGAIEANTLLTKYWQTIRGRRVADIAMGSGGNALFLADKGYFVAGLERSAEAIKIAKKSMAERNLLMWPVLGDAAQLPFRNNSLDGVIIFYFLMRGIIKEVKDLLKKDGILIYETFLKRQNSIDGPRNADYLLDDGELMRHLDGFEILFYEEAILEVAGKRKVVARAVGRKK